MSRLFLAIVISLLFAAVRANAQGGKPRAGRGSPEAESALRRERASGPLPRWREGPRPALDPERSLQPYGVSVVSPRMAPTSGELSPPPEHGPTAGVVYRYSTGAWPNVVRDCVASLTADPAHDELAYVVVASASQQSAAASQFSAAGADMSKVQFIMMPTNSIWIRDYGPHFIWQSGTRAIVDSHYYPTRPLDNFIPTLLADDYFLIPSYDIGLYYSGGNFQADANGNGFMTSLIHLDNSGFGEVFIAELLHNYQGVDTLHIMPQLPWSVDGTGHIDMWMYLIDDDTVIISDFLPGENATAIQITDNAVGYLEALGFEVFRVPALNGYHPYDPNCHYTYTNSYRVNDRIFIPSYAAGDSSFATLDQRALLAYQEAAPEAEIIPIDSYDIIYAAGAIHCIMMQVPRYTAANPAAHVVLPDGGEVVCTGTTLDLQWAATDDEQIGSVDLFCSTDGGMSFPDVLATGEANDGHFAWTISEGVTTQAVVKVVARDNLGNEAQAVSEGPFVITAAPQHIYDFGSGAGADKWGWGYQTASWTTLNGVRHPTALATPLSPTAYARLAYPDASGGDTDPNRYVSPIPSSGYESTHVFEFSIEENPAWMLDIGVLWEGYGDDCVQAELYAWDYMAGNWCNATGQLGENRYLDNFAGNRDGRLEGHIRSDIGRYLDAEGLFTLLVYAERPGEETFHDYVAITVTYAEPADIDADGDHDMDDVGAFVGVLLGGAPAAGYAERCDMNQSGAVNGLDIALFVSAMMAG